HMIVREPAGAGMRGQGARLGRGGVQRVPVRLRRPSHRNLESGHQASTVTSDSSSAVKARLVAVTALIARLRAPPCPYSRAHIQVRTSIMSLGRSSVLSAESATTIWR